MKKFMHLYENVLNWDDSAGEEALLNAKKRYWARINGLPCNLLPPDPDLYIDKIDWDSEVDNTGHWPEFEPEFTGDHEPVVIFGDSFFANQSYSLGGWGDAEENDKNNTKSHNNQGDDDWGQNRDRDSPFDNGPAFGSAGCSNNDLGWDYLGRAPRYWEPKPDERSETVQESGIRLSRVGPLAIELR
ncbi:DNA repair protein recA-like protein [Striga asiatica]|uniref:DNA repair protein recA-like protein n=1 Tax=Striga asiatica TaxID=4170 RepID=A0A5A7NZY8_STRAF|nr:DNA repair protein recA-like protein [Striga asiatica]